MNEENELMKREIDVDPVADGIAEDHLDPPYRSIAIAKKESENKTMHTEGDENHCSINCAVQVDFVW